MNTTVDDMDVPFRRPFGEGYTPSEVEAKTARTKLGEVTEGLLDAHIGKAHVAMPGSKTVQTALVLDFPADRIKAHVTTLRNVETNKNAAAVELYEHGTTDRSWGPRICRYIGKQNEVVRRDDPTAEERQLMASEHEEHTAALAGLRTEMELGLNAQPVDSTEIDELGTYLHSGEPLTYHAPPSLH